MTAKQKALSRKIAGSCAPVLTGVKPSNLPMLRHMGKAEAAGRLFRILWGTGIRARCLHSSPGETMWLLYRREAMEELMAQPDIGRFLREYGYGEAGLERGLERLAGRLAGYKTGETAFPHELGVFLGYPLEDVEGFIRYGGKASRYTGYWQVYGDVERARRMFALYDSAREAVLGQMERDLCLRRGLCRLQGAALE